MTAKEYLETKKRMCNTYGVGCGGCPLIEADSKYCDIADNSDKIITIVQKWGEEHPVKTLMDKFFEVFPDVPRDGYKTPKNLCPRQFGYDDFKCVNSNLNCSRCWSRPYVESKGDAE